MQERKKEEAKNYFPEFGPEILAENVIQNYKMRSFQNVT